MKTIALKDKTFNLIRELKERENEVSFDKLIFNLLLNKDSIEGSMFGSLKNKTKSFTPKERRKIWKDENRI